jgi:hypothetical protein
VINLRHIVLYCINVTKTEEKLRQRFCIDEDSKLRREGEGNLQLYIKYKAGGDKRSHDPQPIFSISWQ